MIPLESSFTLDFVGVFADDGVALATGIDATTATSFSTPAPNVSPNAAIYFLQLSVSLIRKTTPD